MAQHRRSGNSRSESSPPDLTAPPCLEQPSRLRAHRTSSRDRRPGSKGTRQATTPKALSKNQSPVRRADRRTEPHGKVLVVESCAASTTLAAAVDVELLGEDFVEGGVELTPGTADSSHAAPLCSEGLEEYWFATCGPKALFLDYDGTLREFESRPEQAVPTPEIYELLNAINNRQDVVPHLVSGRDASFLATHFRQLHRFTLIAEHGFQILRPGHDERIWELWEHNDDKDHEDWKALLRDEINKFVEDMPGSQLEEKKCALVWHYREVQGDASEIQTMASRLVNRLTRLQDREGLAEVRVSHGHKVVEVSYRKAHKGMVMRQLCEKQESSGRPFQAVLVAGDDVSDESMFEMAPAGTFTIKVGQGSTLARFRVDSPSSLRYFLWQHIVEMSK